MATAVEIARRLDAAVRAAGIPIDGVSIGTDRNRATWTAQYAASASKQQIADGDALIASFDPASAAVIAAEKTQGVLAGLGAVRLFWLAWFRMEKGRDPDDKERAAWTAALVQAAKDASP